MNIFRTFPFLAILSLLLISCDSKKSGPDVPENVEDAATTMIRGQEVRQSNPYPLLPMEMFEKLMAECTYIDYIFSDLPVSISQDQKGSIEQMISFFVRQAPSFLHPTCKPLGRSFYQIDGDIYIEADFYYAPGCTYYIFYQDNKPVYSAKMSQSGMEFFAKMMQSINNQTSPANQ